MALSFFGPHRTVLLVTDDALYIYACTARGIKPIETVPWGSQDFDTNVARIIARDCGGKPVVILNDMVEQHYRKEKVIRSGVGMMDRASLIKRKLSVSFPNYPVRAAFALKEKPPKGEKDKTVDLYIFAALAESPQFTQTIEAVRLSLAPVAGLCLLPVESSDMVKTLATKLSKKGHPKARWVILMGQHANGGLRQIVTRNGELALTRMTPIADPGNDRDLSGWAGEVYQEFNATMSYLSRFGFQPEDGLHVIVIGSSEGAEALQPLMDGSYALTCMTSIEAAQLMGMPLGVQDDLRYADPLHALWAGRKPRFILPMKSDRLDQVSKPRRVAVTISAVLLLGGLFLGYNMIAEVAQIASLGSEIDESQQRLTQLNVQYEKEVKRKEVLGFDVRLVQSSIAVHDTLTQSTLQPLVLFNRIGHAMGKDMRVDKVTLARPEASAVQEVLDASGVLQKPPFFEARLQMTYPPSANIDKGNAEVRGLSERLTSTLPGHKVYVSKYLKDYEYVDEIVVETGDLQKKDVSQDFVAEIIIEGPPEGATAAAPGGTP